MKKTWQWRCSNHFTSRVNEGVREVALTFESVDEILRCDNSNETSSGVLSHGKMWLLCFGSERVGFL